MTRAAPSRTTSERGSAAVELALAVPALVVMLGLLIGGGRLWFDRTTVAAAAQSAARSASLARSAARGEAEAKLAGRQSLDTAGLRCANPSVSVDTGAFGIPVGTPATITSTVSCTVPLTDILLPGMPGAITIVAHGSSALDTYRSRQ